MTNTGENGGTVEVDALYLRETLYPDGRMTLENTESGETERVRAIEVETDGVLTDIRLLLGLPGGPRRRRPAAIVLSGDTVDIVTVLRDIATKIETSRRPEEKK